MKNVLLFAFLMIFSIAFIERSFSDDSFQTNIDATVVHIGIDGPIGPGVSSFVVGAINESQSRDIAAILLTLNTPGGLDSSMREIIQAILDSSKPVVCFVAPSGARAASAGTYILMACHIAAMSHGTTIGAATPVSLGGITPPQGEEPEKGKKRHPDMTDKVMSDSSAYMRGLAELRGRPVDWAERFVSEAASVSDSEALKHGIIEYQSASPRTLLMAINGHKVMVKGIPWILSTATSEIDKAEPTWRDNFLAAITDPNIAYILLLMGIYGLMFEFSNPGLILPGVIGGISLILALYALQLMPVNYAGLALICLGLALITAEAFVPSFGVLGIGGIVAFVLGSIMLLDMDVPGFQISPRLIGGLAAVTSAIALILITMAVRAWRRPAISGPEGMIGSIGTVLDWDSDTGHIHTHGEVWAATSKENFAKGEKVQVMTRNGLVLNVEPQIDEGEIK